MCAERLDVDFERQPDIRGYVNQVWTLAVRYAKHEVTIPIIERGMRTKRFISDEMPLTGVFAWVRIEGSIRSSNNDERGSYSRHPVHRTEDAAKYFDLLCDEPGAGTFSTCYRFVPQGQATILYGTHDNLDVLAPVSDQGKQALKILDEILGQLEQR